MNSRHRAREVALQILYRYDGQQAGTARAENDRPPAQELIRELGTHFDHFQVPVDLREFAGRLVAGTLTELAELDLLLETHASNWKVARMVSVDRSLLRMSIYELKHFPETDSSVIIDEAVELGKQFGSAETPAFVNGILDAIKGVIRPWPFRIPRQFLPNSQPLLVSFLLCDPFRR
jgi:N utilization substance protein B